MMKFMIKNGTDVNLLNRQSGHLQISQKMAARNLGGGRRPFFPRGFLSRSRHALRT